MVAQVVAFVLCLRVILFLLHRLGALAGNRQRLLARLAGADAGREREVALPSLALAGGTPRDLVELDQLFGVVAAGWAQEFVDGHVRLTGGMGVGVYGTQEWGPGNLRAKCLRSGAGQAGP